MAELKTQKNDASVHDFIAKLNNPQLESDCQTLCHIMEELTGAPAKMWGASIVGFGSYRYTYASGKSGDWMEVGFSPRKQNLTIYMMCGFDSFDAKHAELLKKIGPHTTGNSCLYVKRLDVLDQAILKKLLAHSIGITRQKFPASATSAVSDTSPQQSKKTATQKSAVTKPKAATTKTKVAKKNPKKPAAITQNRNLSPQPKATNKKAAPQKKGLAKKRPTKSSATKSSASKKK